MLISSCLIVINKGDLNENSLLNLSFISKISKNFDSPITEISNNFPNFLLILKEFQMNKYNNLGLMINEPIYFENFLNKDVF